MSITYYTIDDLRKGYDEKGVTGWKLSRFLGRNDAFLHYRSLPRSGIKALGIRAGEQDIDLIRCIPLFDGYQSGEDVLVTEFLTQLEGEEKLSVAGIVQEWVRILNVCFLLDQQKIVLGPAPLPDDLADKYLRPATTNDLWSAVRMIFAGDPDRGMSWITPAEYKRRYPPQGGFLYPLVLLYQADGITESGDHVRLEVTPYAFQRLMQKSSERIQQKKN